MTIDWNRISTASLPANCGWKGTYRVRYSEIGDNGKVMMSALADYMQDAAGWGARILKLAYDDTVDQGIAWVLARMVIHIRDYPGNGEDILIETWPSGVSRRVATRDFRLTNSKGEIIGVAQSFWMMFDLGTRRAAQWPDWVAERLPNPPGPKLIEPPLRPAFTTNPLPTMDNIKARPSDLDLYGHVNNVRLMQWVMGLRVRTVDRNFTRKVWIFSFAVNAVCRNVSPFAMRMALPPSPVKKMAPIWCVPTSCRLTRPPWPRPKCRGNWPSGHPSSHQTNRQSA